MTIFLRALTLLLLLVACSAPPLRNQFSELQLRQIDTRPEGMALSLRLSNFEEDPFEVDELQFTLVIQGRAPISQVHRMALEVSGWGTEALQYQVPGATLDATAGPLRYELTGIISLKGFRGSVPFRHEGVLSPIPGVSGSWR